MKKIILAIVILLVGVTVGYTAGAANATNWNKFSIPMDFNISLNNQVRTSQVNAYGRNCIFMYMNIEGKPAIALDCKD